MAGSRNHCHAGRRISTDRPLPLPHSRNTSRNNPDAAYHQVAKAMSAYRLGHFAQSVEWAEKTLKSSIIYANAHAYAILALVHWKLGHKDVARAMLDKGDSLTPSILPSHQAVDLGDSWGAWLVARISLDEAAALIQPASKTDTNSQEP